MACHYPYMKSTYSKLVSEFTPKVGQVVTLSFNHDRFRVNGNPVFNINAELLEVTSKGLVFDDGQGDEFTCPFVHIAQERNDGARFMGELMRGEWG